MTNITLILGQRIRHYRKQQKMSQEQLAEFSDLHPTYIGQIERGEKNATIESIYKISTALKIPISTLLEKLNEYHVPASDIDTSKLPTDDNIPLQIYEIVSLESKESQIILLNIIKYALWIYSDKKKWNSLIKNAMNSDNSWERSAQIYLDMYRELTGQD